MILTGSYLASLLVSTTALTNKVEFATAAREMSMEINHQLPSSIEHS